MPELTEYLQYRNIDVSTIKERVQRWYPQEKLLQKTEGHRALDDIYESIDELSWYKKKIFR